MKLTSVLDRRLGWLVTCVFCFFMIMPPQARATIIESRTSDGASLSQRAGDLDTVRSMLEQEIVVQRLADYGYSKEDALQKIETASDEQLHQLASLSDNLAEGGILGTVIAILVIALLVVLILKLNNKEIVIK